MLSDFFDILIDAWEVFRFHSGPEHIYWFIGEMAVIWSLLLVLPFIQLKTVLVELYTCWLYPFQSLCWLSIAHIILLNYNEHFL